MPGRHDAPRSLIAISLFLLIAPLNAKAAGFIGSESCRACHQAAFDAWQASPHAKAMLSLTAEQQKDTRCLQCHARDQAQGGDSGVSCETCHGAGGYYWPSYVMRDPELARATGLVNTKDTKGCLLCHDAASPSLTPFDAAQKMNAIDHWTKERAARGKAASNCPSRDGKAAHVRREASTKAPQERFLGKALLTSLAPPTGKPDVAVRVPLAQATRAPVVSRALAPRPD